MARAQQTRVTALYAHERVVGQSGGAVLCGPDRGADTPGGLHLATPPRGMSPGICGQLQPEPPAVRLDEERRRDRREGRPDKGGIAQPNIIILLRTLHWRMLAGYFQEPNSDVCAWRGKR